MTIDIKRAYEPASPSDGYRILVDRLWPRGVSKENAALDYWAKEVAPSTELREEWNHDASRFAWFREKYDAELKANPAVVELKKMVAAHPHVTLVYADHDEQANNAIVLRDYLRDS